MADGAGDPREIAFNAGNALQPHFSRNAHTAMFLSPSRITSVALAAATLAAAGIGASSAHAAQPTGGVSVSDSINGTVQGVSEQATAASLGDAVNVAAAAAAIDAAAAGSVGYAFSINEGDQPLASGGAGHARRPLDGTQDMDGTPFTADTRIEVQLPGVQRLLPAAKKGAKARRALAKLNASLLVPTGVEPTSCKGKETKTATHIYNASNLSIGGALIGAATPGTCGAARGLMLSASDLTRLAPLLQPGAGATKGGWTTASGQSDDGQATWQSGEGRFPGGREVHACLASTQGLSLSIIFNAQIPGDQSPCRILLDAINGSRTAS